jgi:hypothetical protein
LQVALRFENLGLYDDQSPTFLSGLTPLSFIPSEVLATETRNGCVLKTGRLAEVAKKRSKLLVLVLAKAHFDLALQSLLSTLVQNPQPVGY